MFLVSETFKIKSIEEEASGEEIYFDVFKQL